MLEFAHAGERDFNAAYGRRIFAYDTGVVQPDGSADVRVIDQFTEALLALYKDPMTRRSAITLWHPYHDNYDNRRDQLDIACNNMVYFQIREGKLNTTVTQRSGDFIWGTPHNMIQFQHLALLMLGELRRMGFPTLQRGSHTHIINSSHIYQDLYPDLLKRLEGDWPCVEVNQSLCELTTTRRRLKKLVKWLDQWEGREAINIDFQELTLDYEEMSGAFNSYWSAIAIMPALYLSRKMGMPVKNILDWMDRVEFPTIFQWLAKDFWEKVLKEGEKSEDE